MFQSGPKRWSDLHWHLKSHTENHESAITLTKPPTSTLKEPPPCRHSLSCSSLQPFEQTVFCYSLILEMLSHQSSAPAAYSVYVFMHSRVSWLRFHVGGLAFSSMKTTGDGCTWFHRFLTVLLYFIIYFIR